MEEVDEEEDKAAKLEALLEQFREPEEPRKKGNPLWLVAALAASVGACWLAIKATEGTIGIVGSFSPPKVAKPAKSSDRSLAKNSPKFSVETYIERCRKGMTPRQLRWVLEDFQKAGLDEVRVDQVWQLVSDFQQTARSEKGPGWISPEIPAMAQDQALELGWQQRAWYLDALADGLSLDVWQRRQSKERCAVNLLETEVEFLKKSDDTHEEGELHPVAEQLPPYEGLVNASYWLEDERMSPWQLVDLTPEQVRITWHNWVEEQRTAEPGSAIYGPDTPWFDPEMNSTWDPASESNYAVGDFPTGDAPKEIDGAGSLFPFLSEQDFSKRPKPGDSVLKTEVLACHPAQVKTLLLLKPELAGELLAELDSSGD